MGEVGYVLEVQTSTGFIKVGFLDFGGSKIMTKEELVEANKLMSEGKIGGYSPRHCTEVLYLPDDLALPILDS